MEEKDIKAFAKKAYVLQKELDNLEESVWNNIKSEVKNKSTFGKYASLEQIYFDIDCIRVKVYDSGYDLYETETFIFSYDQLSELMP